MTTPSPEKQNAVEELTIDVQDQISLRQHVGLIGAGLMGSAIAERLIAAGHAVIGFDVSETCRARLASIGGQRADSARAVFDECRVVIVSLPDCNIVRQMIDEASDSIASHLVIDTTTSAPQSSRILGRCLATRGVEYLDATIVGSSELAKQGDVVSLVGGERHAFDQALPLLRTFASVQFHTGPCGSGATAKLIVNLVLGLNRAVLAEGLSLARNCGVDLPQMLDILRSGAAYSQVMEAKGQKMIDGDFEPQARLDQHWKDVELILDFGSQHGAPLPLSRVHRDLLQRASEMGYGGSDNSAVIRAFDSAPIVAARPIDAAR